MSNVYHSQVLNAITYWQRFRFVENYRYIFMMDHDAFVQDASFFLSIVDSWLRRASITKRILSAYNKTSYWPNHWRRVFYTYPWMLIINDNRWLRYRMRWNPYLFDTGQDLGKAIRADDMLEAYSEPPTNEQVLHLGSGWYWFNTCIGEPNYEIRAYKALCEAVKKKIIRVSDWERKIILSRSYSTSYNVPTLPQILNI